MDAVHFLKHQLTSNRLHSITSQIIVFISVNRNFKLCDSLTQKNQVLQLLLKRVLKYLNTTKDVGILYFQNDDQLEGFSDAGHFLEKIMV
jgi:hypothetical protein